MKNEQWEKVEELFASALERDRGERAAFIAASCAGDERLRAELESLIAAHESQGSALDNPVFDEAVKLLTFRERGQPSGGRIGQYRIIREIGHGGMGAVYLADRADDQYNKQVAIKLIKRGMDTDFLVQRFLAERQILANLDHPNIARLLDGGTTEDGLPYFVMEYIEGLPIDKYCDSHKLSTVERLKLFLTVCSAVQYAHQNLVIHRDIKPGNILITADSQPKLLDFGIAKLFSPGRISQHVERTATAVRMMTPDYASPEQIRGGNIGTTSDVYSLGVLLYKLLTGHHPYHLQSQPLHEIERIICEEDPSKPSDAITRRRRGRPTFGGFPVRVAEKKNSFGENVPASRRHRVSASQLKGDLDNIVLMAMRKEPERRYSSVAQLSEDINRHLEGLPVVAHKDTSAYRASKFIRRHKAGVAAFAVVAVMLIAGIITIAWQAKIAADQRDRARVEAAKSERVNAFLQKMLESADPTKKGRDVKVADLLDETAQRVEAELSAQPELLAAVRRTIGNTYQGLGMFDSAEPHLRAALEAHISIFGEDYPETARTMRDLGMLLRLKGDYASAESLLRQALSTQRKMVPEKTEELATTLHELGETLLRKGETSASEPFFNEALEVTREHFGSQHITAAKSLSGLGLVRENQGDLSGAEQYYRQALDIFRKLPGPAWESLGGLINLGMNLTTQGKYSEAEATFREAVEFVEKRFGKDHPYFGATLIHLGRLHLLEGDYRQAEAEMKKALDIHRRALPPGHSELPQSLSLLGLILTRSGKATEGEPYLRESVEIRKKVLPKGHWLTPNVESALGECLVAQKRYGEAEALLIEGYNGLKSSLGELHPRTIEALHRVVNLYEAWEKPGDAARYRALLPKPIS